MSKHYAIKRWERLAAKQLDRLFKERLVKDLRRSRHEAESLLRTVHETYAPYFQCAPGPQAGQASLQVVCIEAPAGPPLTRCPQVLVTVTLDDPPNDLPMRRKGGVTGLRRQRLARVCHEAFQQGGLLTLEDLAYRLFNCGQRTLCRDLRALRRQGIHPPLRSSTRNLGPILASRRQVIELWLAGQNYEMIARTTFRSAALVGSYVDKFKRVALLHREGVDADEISHLARISVSLAEEYLVLLKQARALAGQSGDLAEWVVGTEAAPNQATPNAAPPTGSPPLPCPVPLTARPPGSNQLPPW